MQDVISLFKITIKIYGKCITTSFFQTIKNWKIILFHLGLILGLGIISVLLPGGNLAFAFIRGFLFTYVLSIYFATVRNIVNKENTKFSMIFSEAMQIFSPLISVYFALMIIDFILKAINMPFASFAFGILFSVLANPLPEVIYLRGGMLGDLLLTSFEFVKGNFIEWFAPTLILLFLLFSGSSTSLIYTFSNNPVSFFEGMLSFLSVVVLNIGAWIVVIPALFLVLFFVLFRANLFVALEKGRRSRLYLAKQ